MGQTKIFIWCSHNTLHLTGLTGCGVVSKQCIHSVSRSQQGVAKFPKTLNCIQIQIHNTNTNIQSKYKIQCISVSRSQEGVARSPKAQDCTQLHLLSSCLHNAMHTIELILVLFHLAAKYSSHIILHPLLPPQRYAHQPLKPRWLPHLKRVAP